MTDGKKWLEKSQNVIEGQCAITLEEVIDLLERALGELEIAEKRIAMLEDLEMPVHVPPEKGRPAKTVRTEKKGEEDD